MKLWDDSQEKTLNIVLDQTKSGKRAKVIWRFKQQNFFLDL